MPFFGFAFVYSFFIAKRDSGSDVLIPSALICLFYTLSLLVFPELVGSGLIHISFKAFSTYTIFFSTVIFAIVVLYLCLQGSFISSLQLLQRRAESFGEKMWKSFGVLLNKIMSRSISKASKTQKIAFQQKAISFLKNGTDKLLDVKKSVTSPEEKNTEIESSITPIIKEKVSEENSIVGAPSDDICEGESDRLDLDTSIKNVRTNPRQNTFFKSKDLVDCINITNKVINNTSDDRQYFEQITNAIVAKLNEFKLPAKIINVLKGPVVDTFELELGEGVKLSKVLSLSDDIGLALNGVPIRIVYPLRGRSTIGIEVPRNPREIIYLDDVLKSKTYGDSSHRLPVMMGKDAFGATKVVDLAGMPHMLVAGATGAGKSVFINTLLVSLIIKKSPRDLKLILIDPKQLELALYERLPHLLMPVITESKIAAVAMLWLVQEMDRRYSVLKDMGVKNIEGFNKKIKSCSDEQLRKITKYYEGQEDQGYEIPYIVCVIDEFADLILTKNGKEIEVNINRLAAKARAAGIHLVVATQRPSTDVVTGTIKANFPTRVAFTVTTGIDSRTILDQYGAEKLLKRGDMLYKHGVDLFRLHSAYVEEEEIEGLVDKLAEIPAVFNSSAVNFVESNGLDEEDMNGDVKTTFISGTSDDPVYNEALEIVLQKGSASASMLQRALRVGYNRAANIIDELEKNGIVGPAQGSKPRQVLGRAE